MNKFASIIVFVAIILLTTTGVQALTITSYDIINARDNGFGAWSHDYTGSITPVAPDLSNYIGGSGTLNDSVIPHSHNDNQLFSSEDNSVVTLHLSQVTTISIIDIFGGNLKENFIPGTLTGATVTISGNSVALSSTNWGGPCLSGACNDRLSLNGTILDGLMTDTIVLSDFQGGWSDSSSTYYNIGEITVNAIPEPETYVMLLAGLGLFAFQLYRKNALSSQC